MGCQAAELNHFTKPFKMGLTLTNRRFNFDKFRVCIGLTCQTFGGSYQDYLDRSGFLDEGRITQGFRWIHLASKPGLIAYYKGPFKLFVVVHKEPPSNIVRCAQWVPMFEMCVATSSLWSLGCEAPKLCCGIISRFTGKLCFVSMSPQVTKETYKTKMAEAPL